MAKNHFKNDVEELEDEDFSSEDINVYKPSNQEEELVVEEDVYNLLEYIDLEWPSQSVDQYDSRIFLGTCPDLTVKKSAFELLKIDLKYTDYKKLDFKKTKIDHLINKIRISKFLFCLADDALLKFDLNLNLIKKITGSYGFALNVVDNKVFVGTSDGYVEVYDFDLNNIIKFKAHESSIEAICFENNFLYTGSTDHTIKIHTITGQFYEQIDNDCDINCIDVYDKKLVYGDDNGIIRLYDCSSKNIEIFEWHASPINFVRWKDADVFASGSEEQLCLWDVSLEDPEDTSYPRCLLFVHQGQKNYKDCTFDDNKIIATTEQGVCVFEPISLCDN